MNDRVSWSLLGGDVAPAGADLRARPESVLAILLLQANRTVSTDGLIDALWADDAPATARNSLARFVSDLRKGLGALGLRVVTDPGGYRVVVNDGELDWVTAQGAFRGATGASTVDANEALRLTELGLSAFRRWPSRALTGLPDSACALRQQDELHVALLELNVDLRRELARHDGLVMDLEALVDRYPLHERFWGQLMQALYDVGRRTEALRTYRRVVAALSDVGLEPSRRLRRLETEIHTGELEPVAVDGATTATVTATHSVSPATPRTTPATSHSIAPSRTSFFGRQRELDEIVTALGDHRLVSVVGLGGIGKTRVADAVARALEESGASVRTAALGSVHAAQTAVSTIADAVGLSALDDDTPQDLAAALGDHSVVLVLDNCEHLLDVCSVIADAVLDAAPHVRLLTTSREPLRVAGEFAYRLGPLPVPAAGDLGVDNPAVDLFYARAAAASSRITRHPETLARVAAICRTVDGVPLAVELAAAQMAFMAPLDLLDRLAEATDRAVVLDGDDQASLGAVLEWCWRSLSVSQQALLARLSVFGESWSLDHANTVCGHGPPIDADLAELVHKSLVSVVPGRGRARYRLLETVRAFACGQLDRSGETAEYADRLVTCLQDLMNQWGIGEIRMWARVVDVIEPEHASITSALDHLMAAGRVEEAAWMAVRTTGLWVHRGFSREARRRLAPMVDDDRLSRAARSAAAATLADLEAVMANLHRAEELARRAFELADGRRFDWLPHAAGLLAVVAAVVPTTRSATELFTTASDVADRSRSRATNMSLVSSFRAHRAFGGRDYERSLGHFDDARSRIDEPGRVMLMAEMGSTCARYMAGDRAGAAESIVGWRSHADTDEWHYLVDVIAAIVRGGAGDPVEATTHLVAAAQRSLPGFVGGRADDFQIAFGMLADWRGDAALAAELLATPTTRQPLLQTMLADHLAARGGVTDRAGRTEILASILERRFGGVTDDDRILADVDRLVAWWSTGSRPFPHGVPA